MSVDRIFFTFIGTLRAMDDRFVGDRDLRTGLFCLDCTRGHAFAPWTPYGRFDPRQTNELKRVFGDCGDAAGREHARFLDALRRAERDGRVLYLGDDTDWHDAEALNAFLEEHGLGRPFGPDDVPTGDDLESLLTLAGHRVKVIC